MRASCGILSLQDSPRLGLVMEHKVFPYIFMRGGQAKSHAGIVKSPLYSHQLLFVNSSSRQGGLVVQDKVVGFEGRLVVFHLVRLTSSLTLMALSYMDITKITLISCSLLHGPVNFS